MKYAKGDKKDVHFIAISYVGNVIPGSCANSGVSVRV